MGLFKKLKKGIKKLGKLASKAAPILGMVPGVGTLAAAGLGGLGALAAGKGLKGALKSGLMGAAGGLAGQALGGMGGLKGLMSGGLKGLAGKFGGMGGLMDLAGNALGGLSAYNQHQNAERIGDEANPFGAHRPAYGNMLAAQMADPSSFASDPGYQFTRDQGLEAVTRKMASQGYGGSGNMATELAGYASGLASQYRGQELDRLAQLAGAGIMPASRASATQAESASNDQLSSLLASIGYGGTRTPTDDEDEEELAMVAGAGQRLGKMTRPSTYIPY